MAAIATNTIVQQAFRFMGIGTLASLSDSDPRVVAANEQYETALNMVLEALDWSFASKVVSLPEISTESITEADSRYEHAYQLPGDLLVLREVIASNVSYRVDVDALRADISGPLPIRYTAKVTNETLTPATFQTTVALQLALFMAPQYVEVRAKREAIANQYDGALARAARTDALSASPQSYREKRADPFQTTGTLWTDEACL